MPFVKLKNLIALLLCFLPVLSYYGFLGTRVLISDIIIFFVLAIAATRLSFRERDRQQFTFLILFFSYTSIVTLIASIEGRVEVLQGVLGLARAFLYLVLPYFILSLISSKLLVVKWLYKLGCIFAGYALLQFLFYHSFDVLLPWSFSFLEMLYGAELVKRSEFYISNFGFRPSAIFAEPAHLGQYLVLSSFAAMKLYLIRSISFHRFIGSIVLIALVALLTGSGTAALSVFGILIGMFIVLLGKHGLTNKLKLGLLFIPVFLISVITVMVYPELIRGFYRVASVGETSSSYIRIFRPFEVLSHMDILPLVLGNGFGTYSGLLEYFGLFTEFEIERGVTWANTAAYVFVSSGVAGACFLFSFFVLLFKNNPGIERILVMFAFVSLFTSDFVFSSFMFLLLVVLVESNEYRKSNELVI
ncbi:hypothetical protein [Pseudidiomarina salilacus]|uniref:hypothetical protein n=1 Tax=Pseudidiomarina salilacus TaxID=3384452 RepID=UPI0039852F1F